MPSLPPLTLRNLALLVVGLVVIGLAYKRLTTPRHGTPEAAIAAVLDAGAAAAREGDVGDLMEHVSEGYQGGADGGPATRGELKSTLALVFARGGGEVRFLTRDIEVRGKEASVRASMIIAIGGLGGLADGTTGAREVELLLLEEDGAWRVVSGRIGALIP